MTGTDRPVPGGRRPTGLIDEPELAAEGSVEDAALLERLRSGEDSAFGELFSRHSEAVRRVALGLAYDRAEAEDLTAEAFFRVLQAIRRGAGPTDNVRGYLLIVARRVAWEWSQRRRDVPVSDEELNRRVGSNPDTVGLSTERTLITRAFTSLPERWRRVLWKVEVEGERPAVVATNFGLSANATAALARRARQGLRAAYLQAHLAVDRSATGCRSVLEKLGAYTAGSIRGSERRRIRTHLAGCASCSTMHAELRDVCSGLRAHAAHLALPAAAVAGAQLIAPALAGGLGALVKGALTSAKLQVSMVASSIAAAGVVGLVAGPFDAPGDSIAVDLDGNGGVQLEITDAPAFTETTILVPSGQLSTRISKARPRPQPAGAPEERTVVRTTTTVTAPDGYDENSPVVYREESIQERSEDHGDYLVVRRTTTVVELNQAGQTTTNTTVTTVTEPVSPTTTTERPTTKPNATSPSPSPSAKAGPAEPRSTESVQPSAEIDASSPPQ